MPSSQDRLYADVAFLTGLQPARNYQNAASLTAAARYIERAFADAGAQPGLQTWQVRGRTYENILASYNAAAARRLVIGAHYDVCGDQPGADDNASAVAGLLEVARMVFREAPQLDYRIDFVAYCLEEPPFFGTESMGSYVHAASLHKAGVEVMGMISLEMIGYFHSGPQPYPSPELQAIYPATADFIMVVGIQQFADFNERVFRLMKSADAPVDVQLIHFPSAGSLAGLSDQQSYWHFGYPALMINDTAFIRNPHYHQQTDTIETLDFEKMAAVVEGAYAVVVGM